MKAREREREINALHNYFNNSTNLFSDPVKFLDILQNRSFSVLS